MALMYPAASAEEKFSNAQRKAFVKELMGALTRRHPKELLSYEDVRSRLPVLGERKQGTQLIDLDKVVGSVGRYRDFTREFLPKSGANRERWKRLDMALNNLEDVPPIEVYKIGDVYFVKDGNHRVSVARANGLSQIEAVVTEVLSSVPFTPDLNPDDLILKEEYADFLTRTHLDELRAGEHIEFTTPGRYRTLLEHIGVHRHFLGLEQQREIPYAEAVASWYDHVYCPAVEVICRMGILDKFPGRTEADLYVWLLNNLHDLTEAYGHPVSLEEAAVALDEQEAETGLARLAEPAGRVGESVAKAAEAVKEAAYAVKDAAVAVKDAAGAVKDTVEEVVKEAVDRVKSGTETEQPAAETPEQDSAEGGDEAAPPT